MSWVANGASEAAISGIIEINSTFDEADMNS
jgi:hypothetical protein